MSEASSADGGFNNFPSSWLFCCAYPSLAMVLGEEKELLGDALLEPPRWLICAVNRPGPPLTLTG